VSHAQAGCPSFVQIFENVSKPLDPYITDQKLMQVEQQLDRWIVDWEQCATKKDSVYGLLLQRRGVVASWLGNSKASLAFFQKAKTIFSKKNGDTKISAKPKLNYLIGECHLLNNNYPAAIAIFDSVLNQPPSKSIRTIQVNSALQLAYIYNAYGDYDQALKNIELGLNRVGQNASDDDLNKLYYEQGFSLRKLERFNAAVSALNKVVALARKSNKPNQLLRSLEVMGTTYAVQNKFDSADYYYKEALRICNAHKLEIPVNLRTNIGFSYQRQARYDEAKIYYQKALLAEPDPYNKIRILTNLGTIENLKQNYEEALRLYQSAFVSINKNTPFQNGQNPTAKSIKIIPRKEYLFDLVTSNADTWHAYAKTAGNDKPKLLSALKTYMLADTMIDYMRWEHNGNISKLFWRDKTRDMYERAIETCYLLNDPVTAFHFFEKSRAVMLNDQLNELGASQLLSETDRIKERSLKWNVSDLQNKVGIEKPATKIDVERLFAAQEAHDSFIKNIEKTNPQYFAYKYDNHTLTIANLRKNVLSDGQYFLSYFVGDSAVYGLLATTKTVTLKRIDLNTYRNLSAMFQPLVDSKELQNRDFKKYLHLSSQLYQLLVKPFNIPSNSRVIVSPDGNFAPFEGLSKTADSPNFLVQDYAFSYTYSARYLAKSPRKSASLLPFDNFMGMAPVDYLNPQMAQVSLPGSDIALKAISEKFLFAKSLTRGEANKKAFLDQAAQYRILQLFTHAQADSLGTMPTLYFSDSTLKLTELVPKHLSMTELLVLSACQTGVGKNQRGEGTFSLSRGFAAIGIPSTINTLWSVENESVYALTRLFYEELLKGQPLDISLQKAQIRWFSDAPKSKMLPYSWAGMVIVGNTDPIATGMPRPLALTIVAVVAMLVLVYLIIVKTRRPVKKTNQTAL
jgi:CHAT domain-containing protein/tetratricopeptide (TPR) repeat protein